jgi:CheY-like chemotaxis protein/signal recognition particle receptor subunit beta
MNEQLILVADSDPKNLQILKENLETAGFRVAVVSNGTRAWEFIKNTPPAIVLSEVTLPEISGLELLERIQEDEQTNHIPLIFLTNRRELQDRVHSLKMGAKDYLVKPLHVKEVIAHIRMVLARLDRRHSKDSNSYFKLVGRLEELSIFDLIESFGVERKTGVLNVINNKKQTGQIFFKDGCVINATRGDFRKEKAVFQMLPWNSGDFSMVFKEVNVPDEIAVSNLGLLLQGLKRMELKEKYIQHLPSSKVYFLPTSTFQNLLAKRKLPKEVVKFVSLFDGKRDINAIIENSIYDEIRTLELINRLHKQGFIKSASPRSKVTRRPSPELPDVQPTIIEDERPPRVAAPKPEVRIKPAPQPEIRPEMKTEPESIPEERPKIRIEPQPRPAPKPDIQAIPEPGPVAKPDVKVEPAPKPAPRPEIDAEPEPIAELKPKAEPLPIAERPVKKPPKAPEVIDDRNGDGRIKPKSVARTPKPPAEEYPRVELEEEIIKTVVFKKKPVEKKPPEVIESVSSQKARSDLFAFIGDPETPQSSLFLNLVKSNYKQRNFTGVGIGEIKVSSIRISNQYAVNLVSIPLKGKFNVLLDNYAEKLSAYALVVDCYQPGQWEYLGYVARMLHERYITPFVVVAVNMQKSDVNSMEVLRDRLNLSQSVPVFICEPITKANIQKMFAEHIPNWPLKQSRTLSEKDFVPFEIES